MAEQERQEENAAEEQAAVPAESASGGGRERQIAPAGPPTAVLAPRSQPGDLIVSRRSVLQLGFWASMGAIVAGSVGAGLSLIWPRGVKGFGGQVSAGDVSSYPPGSKTQITEGRFWLVHLTPEQGGPGLLALWWKCPHLGCTVPWRPTFIWPDPTTGAPKSGWFRCPCHGSTYTDAGVRVFGPAPRSMDTMALSVEGGRISVNTGAVTPGAPDNPDRAVRV